MKWYIKVAIWFVFVVIAADVAFRGLTASSTIENLLGIALAIFVVYVSDKTTFFLNFKNLFNFKRNQNNEKNN